jgi:1-acyl-sn-glycerol-3-phosphate acyltransferase
MYWIIKWWAFIFLRLYFRKTLVYGLKHVPEKGPLIVACNHPSAFLEASIMASVLKRPIHFLVRGDMFHPRFKWLFTWTKQIPIYRQKDGISNLRKNLSSFDLTYRKLSEGEAILIFPEAKTILEKKMRPIQRGTAHLAFGTLPFLKNNENLMVVPVGVNFTEPRTPGTDVVVAFGEPFISISGNREDRVAIDSFTQTLSSSMDPLIIQVDDALEKNYDVAASIYFRMVYENHPGTNALEDLKKITYAINNTASNKNWIESTGKILTSVAKLKNKTAAYFPDLIIMNKMGLAVLLILKLIWLIAGGWSWRLVKNIIFSKIKTDTFQGPTTVGVYMVVMPLLTLILFIICLIAGIPLYFVLIWVFVMWLGALIRPPFDMVWKLLTMDAGIKAVLKKYIIEIRENIEHLLA